ncbi:MAG: YbaB/EbfC family nucleoid-associated protein [Sedimentisphaerales bacterium]|nr:YbaB/EbfC family nucleoid-associated protein [Sedimentisphaerales bacterium]
MLGFGDITKMFGQLKDIQSNMQKLQEDMEQKIVEAHSGGGMVTARVNGKGELLAINIEPSAVDPNDVEMLEDLIKAAVTAAMTKSQDQMKQEMMKLTGGLDFKGLEQLGKMLG